MENGGAKAATLRLLRRMLPSFSSNDWFLRRRMAAQRVVDINNGLFYLLSRVYFGENTRHWILCTSCGNAFRADSDEADQSFQRKPTTRSRASRPVIGAQRRWSFGLTSSR